MSIVYAIDASSANKQTRTGVEWYAYHLIEHMKRHALLADERVVLYSPTPLTGALAELPTGWESRVIAWPFPGWMRLRMSWELWRKKPSVFFVPAQGLPAFSRGRILTTIHDVGWRRRPDLYDSASRRRLDYAMRQALTKATKLFVVSEFTKREVLELYKVAEDRLVVTPLAHNATIFHPLTPEEVEPVLNRYRLGRHYFLHVGRWERKKNVATLIRAFVLFKATRGVGDPYELVLVGRSGGCGSEETERALRDSPARESIRTLPYLVGEEIAALMNAATAFVFPSLYEGFGIPNLEALACGAPLLTSHIPPHHEVAGDAARYVPPEEPEAWAQAMRELALEPTMRVQWRDRGLEQARRFSWEKTATQTWETMRRVWKM